VTIQKSVTDKIYFAKDQWPPRNHNMWHSVIVSVAVTDREMYAEHRAPSAPPGGPLMNHHFRVGN